jgi:hypothetical protein
MRWLALACLALLTACGSSEDDAPRVTVETISIVPPADWEATALGATARTWAPATNPRKESITVIVGPPLIGTPERALDRTRVAQGALREGHLVATTPLVTASGLVGNRFDATFSPEAARGRVYHRSHAVVVVGDRTVNVLYTAETPDPTRSVLRRVVDSIQQGG